MVTQMVKNLPVMQEIQVQFLGWEDSLEKGMTTHSSILFVVFFRSSPCAILSGTSATLVMVSALVQFSRYLYALGIGIYPDLG